MKVLLLSLYHPELVRGGAQQVCYELFQCLKQHENVEPVLLAAIDPSFKSLYKSGAQITGFDGRDHEFLFLSRDYDYFWHRVSSDALAKSFKDFLELIRPDVIHFHHFLLIGIDFLTLARRVLPDVRIILTFHEFLAICEAGGHMLRKLDGSLCSRSSQVRCHQCFPNIEPERFFVRDLWMKKHLSCVDAFTVPSRFMIQTYATWGLEPARIHHVVNGQPNYNKSGALPAARAKRNRFGFFGQLVDNKGVWLLLQSVQMLRAAGFTDFVVEVNGDNLQYASDKRRHELEAFMAQEERLPLSERIVLFNGSYSVDQLAHRMARVDWCIVPSVWWEIFGLVISEAWMFKRPVIASNVGGPAERISHEKDGLLFDVGDAASLASCMRRAATDKGLWESLVKGIVTPRSDTMMTDEFLALYRSDDLNSNRPERELRER